MRVANVVEAKVLGLKVLGSGVRAFWFRRYGLKFGAFGIRALGLGLVF